MGLHLKYYTHVSIVYMSLHKWSQTHVNACTFVGKRGFLFAQTRLDVNLDVDWTWTVLYVLYSLFCMRSSYNLLPITYTIK